MDAVQGLLKRAGDAAAAEIDSRDQIINGSVASHRKLQRQVTEMLVEALGLGVPTREIPVDDVPQWMMGLHFHSLAVRVDVPWNAQTEQVMRLPEILQWVAEANPLGRDGQHRVAQPAPQPAPLPALPPALATPRSPSPEPPPDSPPSPALEPARPETPPPPSPPSPVEAPPSPVSDERPTKVPRLREKPADVKFKDPDGDLLEYAAYPKKKGIQCFCGLNRKGKRKKQWDANELIYFSENGLLFECGPKVGMPSYLRVPKEDRDRIVAALKKLCEHARVPFTTHEYFPGWYLAGGVKHFVTVRGRTDWDAIYHLVDGSWQKVASPKP